MTPRMHLNYVNKNMNKKRRETRFTKVQEIYLAAFCRLALQSFGALQHFHILGCYILQKHNTPFNKQMFTSQWYSAIDWNCH